MKVDSLSLDRTLNLSPRTGYQSLPRLLNSTSKSILALFKIGKLTCRPSLQLLQKIA